ncbi:hypothetical protein [Amycolatopsis sp. FDAARGOS 1241]|uniref:hypothetical protein n=1 Tax=Amycolatopsis sp. FDAARGOS 1241 TaxID=2778070 RepID=UPI00194ECF2B|nr:hypothetical protein [Amycolatopsis sp. FDAARGOS 1241]QRP43621.1 hypothetical protein I6J71_30110 [Amycolatopsis sp. FDAARGOS 1241]
MSTEAYVSFLAIGVVLVLIDGQIIYRSGRGYLESSYGDAAASASMTRLVTVLFHLVTLGLLALLSTIPLGASDLPGVVGRIGVLLLVLAIVHAVTLAVLGRIRGEQVGEAVVNRRLSRREAERRAVNVTTTAVPAQEASYPDVSPPLEHRAP